MGRRTKGKRPRKGRCGCKVNLSEYRTRNQVHIGRNIFLLQGKSPGKQGLTDHKPNKAVSACRPKCASRIVETGRLHTLRA